MKRCSKCGEIKALSEFPKCSKIKSGLRADCKKCYAVVCRRYYLANRAKIKAYQAKYRAVDCNKHQASIAQQKWKVDNVERNKANNAKYYAEHKKQYAAHFAKWQKDNPDKVIAISNRRRAYKLGAGGDATAEQIAARWEVYGDTCYICGIPAEATDHVIPLAAGGSNWPANLRPICNQCNSRKGATWPYSPVTTEAIVSSDNKKCPSRSLWRVR